MLQLYHFITFFRKIKFGFPMKKEYSSCWGCVSGHNFERDVSWETFVFISASHVLFNDAVSIEDEIVSNEEVIGDESERTWKEADVV